MYHAGSSGRGAAAAAAAAAAFEVSKQMRIGRRGITWMTQNLKEDHNEMNLSSNPIPFRLFPQGGGSCSSGLGLEKERGS